MQGILSIFQGIVNSSYLDVDIFLKSLKAHQSFRYNVCTFFIQYKLSKNFFFYKSAKIGVSFFRNQITLLSKVSHLYLVNHLQGIQVYLFYQNF